MVKHIISDKALINADESVGKSVEYGFQSGNRFRKRLQGAATLQFPRVMGNRFDAKDAFAFSIDLEGQVAAVQLEDRQIIHRSLDRDFPFGRTPAIFRAMLVTEDGLYCFLVWGRAVRVCR